ncbi:MAG: hypothetical protein ACKPKO_38345, partial [Candidatus Fonsibacter sp.]
MSNVPNSFCIIRVQSRFSDEDKDWYCPFFSTLRQREKNKLEEEVASSLAKDMGPAEAGQRKK